MPNDGVKPNNRKNFKQHCMQRTQVCLAEFVMTKLRFNSPNKMILKSGCVEIEHVCQKKTLEFLQTEQKAIMQ